MREGRPFVFASLRKGEGLPEIIRLVREMGGL
jgi:hypothetical protein